MKFYKVLAERHDYFTGNTTVLGELVTQKERDRKYRYLSDDIFQEVEVSKKKTVWIFGARFEQTEEPGNYTEVRFFGDVKKNLEKKLSQLQGA